MSDDSEDWKTAKVLIFLFLFVMGINYYDEIKDDILKKIKQMEVPNYMEPVRNNDFEAAHKALDKLYLIYQKDTRDYEIAEQYVEAERNVFSAEVRYLIAEKDPEEATKRIQFLLNEFIHVGQHPESYYSYSNPYPKSVKAKNAICDQIVDLGILAKNKVLVELALSHYLNDPENNKSTDKDAAEKKYKEAVKRGAFK